MIDLVIIGAIIHFCILGYRIMEAYEYDVYHRQHEDDDQ